MEIQMKRLGMVLLLLLGCVNKTEKSQEKSIVPKDSDIVLSPPIELCDVKGPKNFAGIVDYPYVHLADVKDQKILVFGYAKVDLSFSSLETLMTPQKSLKAPPQKMKIVLNPPSGLNAKISSNLKNASCVLDVEKTILSLQLDLKETVYLEVETPALEIIVDPKSTSFCDLKVQTMSVAESDVVKMNLTVKNELAVWWGPVGKLFTEGFADILKKSAVVTGNEMNLQKFVLSQMQEVFEQDMLLTVKKSLGCRL
jgi:hypothetical protein